MLSRQLTLLIEAYADGDLTLDERVKAEEALAGSAECREYHRQLVVLKNLLKSSSPAVPSDAYFQESQSLILAKTIDRESVYSPGQEVIRPTAGGLRRAVYSAVVSLSILVAALSIGTRDSVNYAVVRMDSSEYLASVDVREKLSATDDLNSQVETTRLASSQILIGSLGSVGRAAQPPVFTLSY